MHLLVIGRALRVKICLNLFWIGMTYPRYSNSSFACMNMDRQASCSFDIFSTACASCIIICSSLLRVLQPIGHQNMHPSDSMSLNNWQVLSWKMSGAILIPIGKRLYSYFLNGVLIQTYYSKYNQREKAKKCGIGWEWSTWPALALGRYSWMPKLLKNDRGQFRLLTLSSIPSGKCARLTTLFTSQVVTEWRRKEG